MNKQRFFSLLIAVLCVLLLASSVLAMSSSTYRMDWFVPLTGSGGPASSSHYAINITVGQAAIGTSASPHAQSCLGYWCSSTGGRIYLPLVVRN